MVDIIRHTVSANKIHLTSYTDEDGCGCTLVAAGTGSYDLGEDSRPRYVVCISGAFFEEAMGREFTDKDTVSNQLILDPGETFRFVVRTTVCLHIWTGRLAAA